MEGAIIPPNLTVRSCRIGLGGTHLFQRDTVLSVRLLRESWAEVEPLDFILRPGSARCPRIPLSLCGVPRLRTELLNPTETQGVPAHLNPSRTWTTRSRPQNKYSLPLKSYAPWTSRFVRPHTPHDWWSVLPGIDSQPCVGIMLSLAIRLRRLGIHYIQEAEIASPSHFVCE
jgi:hypothetical protein